MKKNSSIHQAKQELQNGHVSAWRQSGLSQSAYCRQHELRPSTFSGWLTGQQKSMTRPVTLVPIPDEVCLVGQSANTMPEAAGLSLVAGHCCRIEIDKQFDARTLARLIAMLEAM